MTRRSEPLSPQHVGRVITDEILAWVTANKDKPFFLFDSITLPHGRHEIDD